MRRAAAVVFALAAHAHASAQVSGSVALVSDYLYRGMSLSRGQPSPQLTVVYDNPDGWYLSGLAARIRPRYGNGPALQYSANAGFARRLASGISWDVGLSTYAVPAASAVNFQEVYAGLASEQCSAKLSYAPNYLGLGTRTLYAEAAASERLGEKLNLFAHAGYLAALDGADGKPPTRRADARIGLGVSAQDWEFQLAWSGAHQRRAEGKSYATPWRKSDSVVLNIVRRF